MFIFFTHICIAQNHNCDKGDTDNTGPIYTKTNEAFYVHIFKIYIIMCINSEFESAGIGFTAKLKWLVSSVLILPCSVLLSQGPAKLIWAEISLIFTKYRYGARDRPKIG